MKVKVHIEFNKSVMRHYTLSNFILSIRITTQNCTQRLDIWRVRKISSQILIKAPCFNCDWSSRVFLEATGACSKLNKMLMKRWKSDRSQKDAPIWINLHYHAKVISAKERTTLKSLRSGLSLAHSANNAEGKMLRSQSVPRWQKLAGCIEKRTEAAFTLAARSAWLSIQLEIDIYIF